MSLHTDLHGYDTPSWENSNRTQKWFYLLLVLNYLDLNIKPPRHRFGLSLSLGLAILYSLLLSTNTTCKEVQMFRNIITIVIAELTSSIALELVLHYSKCFHHKTEKTIKYQ